MLSPGIGNQKFSRKVKEVEKGPTIDILNRNIKPFATRGIWGGSAIFHPYSLVPMPDLDQEIIRKIKYLINIRVTYLSQLEQH